MTRTLLMVVASVSSGRPALMSAWRAGDCPTAAWRTLPMYTSSTDLASIPAAATAALMAVAPSSGAVTFLRHPLKEPTGVRDCRSASWRRVRAEERCRGLCCQSGCPGWRHIKVVRLTAPTITTSFRVCEATPLEGCNHKTGMPYQLTLRHGHDSSRFTIVDREAAAEVDANCLLILRSLERVACMQRCL